MKRIHRLLFAVGVLSVILPTISLAAVSVSNLTAAGSAGVFSSYTTSSTSPTANRLEVMTISSRNGSSTDPNIPTMTGNGLTWVVVTSTAYDVGGTSRRRITVLRALGASPTTGTTTVDFAGQFQSSMSWSLNEFSGVDTSGTNGSGAVVQSVFNQDTTAGVNTLTVTLGAFGSVNNATFGAFATGGVASETTVEGTGFTKISGTLDAGGDISQITEWKTANDTSVDMTNGVNTELGGIAIEIKAATVTPATRIFRGVGISR